LAKAGSGGHIHFLNLKLWPANLIERGKSFFDRL